MGEWAHKWAIADELQVADIATAPVEHLRDMLENDPQLPGHYQVVPIPEICRIDASFVPASVRNLSPLIPSEISW